MRRLMCDGRSNMWRLAVLLFVPLALSAQMGQVAGGQPVRNSNAGAAAPPAVPPTPPGDLCTVEGQIFDASTGEPLRKASISLNLIRMSPGMAPGPGSY